MRYTLDLPCGIPVANEGLVPDFLEEDVIILVGKTSWLDQKTLK